MSPRHTLEPPPPCLRLVQSLKRCSSYESPVPRAGSSAPLAPQDRTRVTSHLSGSGAGGSSLPEAQDSKNGKPLPEVTQSLDCSPHCPQPLALRMSQTLSSARSSPSSPPLLYPGLPQSWGQLSKTHSQHQPPHLYRRLLTRLRSAVEKGSASPCTTSPRVSMDGEGQGSRWVE